MIKGLKKLKRNHLPSFTRKNVLNCYSFGLALFLVQCVAYAFREEKQKTPEAFSPPNSFPTQRRFFACRPTDDHQCVGVFVLSGSAKSIVVWISHELATVALSQSGVRRTNAQLPDQSPVGSSSEPSAPTSPAVHSANHCRLFA